MLQPAILGGERICSGKIEILMSGYPFFHPFRGRTDKNYAFKVWFYTLISCRKVNGYAPEYVVGIGQINSSIEIINCSAL